MNERRIVNLYANRFDLICYPVMSWFGEQRTAIVVPSNLVLRVNFKRLLRTRNSINCAIELFQ